MRAWHILLEKQNYQEMFSRLQGKDADADEEIATQIEWARKKLKRKDRIVWYLRLVRYKIARQTYNEDLITKDTLHKYANEIKKNYNITNPEEDLVWSGFSGPRVVGGRTMKERLEHYMSLQAPEVQNVEFSNQTPVELFSQLEKAEEEWTERVGGKAIQPQEDDYELIEFDGGWAWWVLPRPYCEHEGASMGHCGNEPTWEQGDEILSLRQHVDRGLYVPHLTFILKDGGYLGEMKGRGNEKPKPKYHPYIVELLLHDTVQGIQGGGYKPENNFSLQDLDEELREELFRKKPRLKPLDVMFWDWRNGGEDEKAQYFKKLQHLLAYHDLGYQTITEDGVIVETWSHPYEFLNDYGSEDVQHIIETMSDGELVDIHISRNDIDQGNIDELYDSLPRQTKEKIIDFLDAKGENVREEAPSDLLTNYEELVDMFVHAIQHGMLRGTEKRVQDELIDMVQGAEMVPPGPGVGDMRRGEGSSIYYIISHRDMSDLLSSPGREEEINDLSAEQYEFYMDEPDLDRIEDYDEPAALEHLKDEIEHTL